MTSLSRRCRVHPNSLGQARMPVSRTANSGVRAKTSSTGTNSGTTAPGGWIEAGLRNSTRGGSVGSEADTARRHAQLHHAAEHHSRESSSVHQPVAAARAVDAVLVAPTVA
jgi:hypothetical protein